MYRLDDEGRTTVEEAAALADDVLLEHSSDVDEEGRFPRQSVDALAEAGFLGLTVPEEYGGMGHDPRVACAVLDELARRCPSTAMIYFMHLSALTCYLERPDRTEPQLREAARGEHLTTLAWSERGSRSHFWAPVSREVRRNGRIEISAEKSFVTAAGQADGYVVSTRWENGEAPTDSMLYLVLKEDDGLDVSGPWKGLGMRGNASAPMTLEDVELPPERALSEPGAGMQVMLEVVLPVFQTANAAISVGIAEAACEITREHLTGARLEHQDSRLADLPNLRERLARMRIETDRARAHLVSVLDAMEAGRPEARLLVLASKATAAETAMEVTDIGMKACGGAAFGRYLPLERFFRDARAATIMAPTTDQLHDFVGRALCGMEVMG